VTVPNVKSLITVYRSVDDELVIQGGPKKRIPSFIFGITSVIQHRF